MNKDKIYEIGDLVAEAQIDIQQKFANVDPVVSISRNMRKSGFPADTMTIDCLKTKKRILFILHDDKPNKINYQFCFSDQDPGPDYKSFLLEALNKEQFFEWMKDYFVE